MPLHHVNFHTAYSTPVFEDTDYDALLRACLRALLRRQRILCLQWEILPTHVHMIIQDFPDYPLNKIMQRIKGGTAHAFFQAHPHLRADLFGGHLWSKGYYKVPIETHDQFCATLAYIRANREHAGLPPPVALQHVDHD